MMILKYLLQDIYSVFWREMKHYIKDKSSLIMAIMQPMVWLLLMGYGMSGFTSSNPYASKLLMGAPNYITYITPGIVVMTALFGGLYGGVSLLSDRRFGYINKMLSAPIQRCAIPLGKMIAVLFQSLIQVLLVIFFSYCFGVRFKTGILGFIIILIIDTLFCIIMSSISLILSLKFKTHNAIYSLVSFITMPLMFTSSALFPSSSMPRIMEFISKINPITYAVDAIRNIGLQGIQWNLIQNDILILAIAALIFIIATVKMFQVNSEG